MNLLELAGMVEHAANGSRELDWHVAEALGHEAFARTSSIWPPFMDGSAMDRSIPAYTASIDAAMTLVPKGWWWSVGDCSVSSDASVGPDVAHCDKALLIRFDDGIHADLPQPSTPALALTAVALKARALSSQEREVS